MSRITDHCAHRYPEPILRWTSSIYDDALRACGVAGFATHANDYCINDRKFGGNAQSISGRRSELGVSNPRIEKVLYALDESCAYTSASCALACSRACSLVGPLRFTAWRASRWLHHTSLLWDYDRERMALLSMPAKRPAYRADRSHETFIQGLAAAGVPGRGELVSAVIDAAAQRLELCEVDAGEARAAMDAPHRKTTRLVDLDCIDR